MKTRLNILYVAIFVSRFLSTIDIDRHDRAALNQFLCGTQDTPMISNKCFIHRPAVTIPSHCSYSHLTTGMQEDAVWPGGMIDKTWMDDAACRTFRHDISIWVL